MKKRKYLTQCEAYNDLLERGFELHSSFNKRNGKILVECIVHGIFFVSTYRLLMLGGGCTFCKDKTFGKSLYTQDDVFNIFKMNKFLLLEKYYNNVDAKLSCICDFHPEIIQKKTLRSLLIGHGCKYCGMIVSADKRRHSYEFIFDEFKKRNYKLLDDEYINGKTHLSYICEKHPEVIQRITYSNLLNGYGCRFCGFEKISESKTYKFEFVKDCFEKEGYNLISTEYKGIKYKLEYICPNHPLIINSISFDNFLQGKRCPLCAIERKSNAQRLTFDFVKSQFAKRYYNLLASHYENNSTKMPYVCEKHPYEVQYITYGNLSCGKGCKFCKISSGEMKIISFMLSKDVKFEFQKTFEDCKYINILRFDFYLPDYNTVIEFQGEQHYYPVDFANKGEEWARECFYKNKLKDSIKKEYCKKNNIELLEISYIDLQMNNVYPILSEFFKKGDLL